MSGWLDAASETEALELLHELGCTDGLPVVIPTEERVAAMVLASALDADLSLGEMGPAGGIATVGKVATAAVMAGCLPDYMPLVMATIKAVLQPEFDLTEMQATTHCTAPLVIVNGPVRQSVGLHGGTGALGPGFRANASVGRALRLAMLNIGGATPGEADMALHGHPGKFTYCLAEDEEASPFEPMHVSLGYGEEDSVVTVIGAEAPHSVIYSATGDAARDATGLIEALVAGVANTATNNAILRNGAAVIMLNPEHAELLHKAGYTRKDTQQAIFDKATFTAAQLARAAGGFAPRNNREAYNAFRQPEDVLILVAGGSGLYSMVMPTWCAGPHVNRFVSEVVELELFCEVPGLQVPV